MEHNNIYKTPLKCQHSAELKKSVQKVKLAKWRESSHIITLCHCGPKQLKTIRESF